MKKNTYTIPLALVFCLLGDKQQSASYNDPAIDEDLRAEYL